VLVVFLFYTPLDAVSEKTGIIEDVDHEIKSRTMDWHFQTSSEDAFW